MNIAIISDIHSNSFALSAVLGEFEKNNIDKLIVLGDMFGYYPWAYETYCLLRPYLDKAHFILGNHDELLLQKEAPNPIPSYWHAAKQNENELEHKAPEAIDWLKSLNFNNSIQLSGLTIKMFHGTPDDERMGRFYPDNQQDFDWFTENNEIILLGHTHYPLIRHFKNNLIINPGSVGQPRDGNPMPSWGVLNLKTCNFRFIRTNYDNFVPMSILEKMNWEKKAILSLNKKGI